MDYLIAELEAGELAPVLLGNSKFAKLVSRRFFYQYGIISHVFCDQVPFLKRFSLAAKYHLVKESDRDDLLLMALQDFAKSAQSRDVVLYLIPASEKELAFIRRNKDRLEADFVLSNVRSLSNMIGDLLSK